jgi:hypothetical protein
MLRLLRLHGGEAKASNRTYDMNERISDKRELFAAMALQGLLSNAAIAEGVTKVKETLTQEQAREFETKILPMANAICALSHADALLSALNQQPEATLPEHKESKSATGGAL